MKSCDGERTCNRDKQSGTYVVGPTVESGLGKVVEEPRRHLGEAQVQIAKQGKGADYNLFSSNYTESLSEGVGFCFVHAIWDVHAYFLGLSLSLSPFLFLLIKSLV